MARAKCCIGRSGSLATAAWAAQFANPTPNGLFSHAVEAVAIETAAMIYAPTAAVARCFGRRKQAQVDPETVPAPFSEESGRRFGPEGAAPQ
jgi:hypothetical protein